MARKGIREIKKSNLNFVVYNKDDNEEIFVIDGKVHKRLTVLYPDAETSNADWTKTKWDLPKYKSEEFYRILNTMGITIEHFRTLPVYKYNIATGRIKE